MNLSVNDKLNLLMKDPNRLVLVQFHELERIKIITDKHPYAGYIESLYRHYIVLKKGKTYESIS